MKAYFTSKRVWIAVAVILGYFVTNPDQIAALGIPTDWQVRIIAVAGLITKVLDTMKATPV